MNMEQLLTMPRLGLNMEEGTIIQWYVAIGEQFSAGTPLCEIESEKTTSDFAAPCDGVMVAHLVAPEEAVAVGEPIARYRT